MNKSVQQELKLSEEQVKKIEDTANEIREKHQAELEPLRQLDRQEQRQKAAPIRRKIADETRQALAGVLQPEQQKRLKQIELQQRGARAFQEPKVQDSLKLTDEQKGKINTINEDAARKRREARQGAGRGNSPETRSKLTALRKESMEKALAVLTPEQKTTWEEMAGKPFEIKFEGPRGQQRGRNRQ